MGFWVFSYVGWAIAYSIAASLAVFLLSRFIGHGVAWRHWPLIGAVFFFVSLTQHPFPDPAMMQCPTVSGGLDLQLFSYFRDAQRILDAGEGFLGLIRNLTLTSMAMNLVICMMIGIFCTQSGFSFWTSAGLATLLTTIVEVSQLTGVFGIFPCAYREFSVNDMFLNIMGVVVGSIMAKHFLPHQ